MNDKGGPKLLNSRVTGVILSSRRLLLHLDSLCAVRSMKYIATISHVLIVEVSQDVSRIKMQGIITTYIMTKTGPVDTSSFSVIIEGQTHDIKHLSAIAFHLM